MLPVIADGCGAHEPSLAPVLEVAGNLSLVFRPESIIIIIRLCRMDKMALTGNEKKKYGKETQ